MKKQEALSVGEIIEQAIAQTGNRDEYYRQQACFLWQEVVGPTINQYTTRRWVDRDVMHVCISSGPLKSELAFHREALVNNINKILGREILSDIIIH